MVSSTYPKETEQVSLLEKLSELNQIGIALSAEHDIPRLMEKILLSAKKLTNADGCTLYTVTEEKNLHFEVVACDSLGLLPGKAKNISDIPLYLEGGAPNEKAVSAYAALHGKVINIADVYEERGFDFTGPHRFDEAAGYRTKSLLACPMVNYEGERIGVLQLINAFNPKTGKIIPFSREAQELATSLASQAAIALSNQKLLLELKNLFESLIRMIASAVDEKSPSMGNHARRVPIIAQMLAEAVNETERGPLKDISLSTNELYQLLIAAFLHDAGKITTPDHILEKHAKMEVVFNRFELIRLRLALKASMLKEKANEAKLNVLNSENPLFFAAAHSQFESIDKTLQADLGHLRKEGEFLEEAASGKRAITPSEKEKIEKIASKKVEVEGKEAPLLTDEEVELLTIPYGNLTGKERHIIENHVASSYRLLTRLPFPKNLARVPEIAGTHHERLDGSGYPRKLKDKEISLEARILAIADVFEALSAPDRAYKSPLPLSKAYEILAKEVEAGHLDRDLYQVFLDQKVGLRYAEEHLKKEQIDVE